MDTYIPSGEESAQEQQFLQGLVGQIQSRDAVAIPKYATQLFNNFCGNYQTLAVNATMEDAVSSGFFTGKMDKYFGFYITNEGAVYGNQSNWVNPPSSTVIGGSMGWSSLGYPLIAGCPAGRPPIGVDSSPAWVPSPTYVGSVLSWSWTRNPTSIIAQPFPSSLYDPQSCYPQLSYFRQSFSTAPFYIWMPKWMKSFSIGMRLYNNAGASQNILIASKTNAKWQSPTINSSVAPDGSYSIEALSQAQLKSELGARFGYYVTATRVQDQSPTFSTRPNAFSSQSATYAELWNILNFEDAFKGGVSVIKANLLNRFTAFQEYIIQFWTDDIASGYYRIREPDDDFTPTIPSIYTNANPSTGSPQYPDYSATNINQTFEFSLPTPPSLPYRYYFRVFARFINNPPLAPELLSYTYAVDYPAGYPSVPATFTMEPATYDVVKLIIANYSAVNPQPTGFPTPPVGVTQFNYLDLPTMPLIATDITEPLV